MRPILHALLLLFSLQGLAQITTQPVVGRYLVMGAYSRQFADVYSTRANAASLAGLSQPGAAVYGEKRFMLDNLNLYTFSAGLPTSSGAFGLYGSYFGFAQSNQLQGTLSYGRKVANGVEVGGSFHYHTIRQAGIYGSASVVTGSVSMRMMLSDKITAGINAYNPVRATWNKSEDERLPSIYTLGLGYDASEKMFLTAEIEKEENLPVNVNAALHYQFIPQFFIRTGIATNAANYFAGLGFQFTDFRFDVACSYHPQLGLSPGVLLLMNFGKKQINNTASIP